MDLLLDDMQRRSGFAVVQGLADAHDRHEPATKRGRDLLAHMGVGLAEMLPPLAVPDDDPTAARVDEHGRAYFAREGAGVFPIQVLPGELDAALVAFVRACGERGERRRDHEIDVGQLRRERHDGARELDARPAAEVHLPVARDERAADRVQVASAERSTSMPGSFLPSMSSRDAPPPVEMCFILFAMSPPAA